MQILKDYLNKVKANVQQVGRHRAYHCSQERISDNITPEVSPDAALQLRVKGSNKGYISDHPIEKVCSTTNKYISQNGL